jgi:hypothetical protein
MNTWRQSFEAVRRHPAPLLLGTWLAGVVGMCVGTWVR